MSGSQGPNNPFVRFKREVDSQVSQLFHSNSQDMHSADPSDARSISGSNSPPASRDMSAVDRRTLEPYGSPATLENITEQLRRQTISSWLKFSAYSPDNLQLMPQPQPVGSGNVSHGRFTFHDAFEDLLRVTSGQSLKDLVQVSSEDVTHPSFFFSVFLPGFFSPAWHARLEDRRLWDAYFPRSDFQNEAQSILHKVAEASRYRQQEASHEALIRSLITEASKCEEEVKMTSIFQQLTSLGPSVLFGFGDDHGGDILRELNELHDPWLKKIGPTESDNHTTEKAFSRDPGTEEDMHKAFYSLFSNGWPRSIPSWDDILSPAQFPVVDASEHQEFDNSTETKTVISADGSRTVTTTVRQCRGGTMQTTVTTEKQDLDGNVIERSETTRSFSSTTHEGRLGQEPGQEPGQEYDTLDGTETGRRRHGSNGWFWTKRD